LNGYIASFACDACLKRIEDGVIAHIALGSNLGDRSKNISIGISELAKLGQLTPSPLI